MATGTVQFQFGTLATPPPGLAIMADAVNDIDHGAGTAQYIKIMDGATGGTLKAGVTARGLSVDPGTVQVLGTIQSFGTTQSLGTFQQFGTSQVLGSVQAVGTTSTKEIVSTSNFGTRIAGTVGNLIVLQANPNRIGASFYVEMGSALFLKHGSLSGTFDYTVQITAGALYELPFNYSGTVSGIWQFASGTVQITEVR